MRKTLSAFLFIILFYSVSFGQIKTSRLSGKGFLNSKSYKEYLAMYINKSEIQFADKRFFTLIGEESFLYDSNYDSYIIYILGSKDNSATILILKSKNGISNSTIKQVAQTEHLFFAKEVDSNNGMNFKINSFTKIISGQKAFEFKNFLSTYTRRISNRTPAKREETFRLLFYFDGKNYYRISSYQIDSASMDKIDKFFNSSMAFQFSIKKSMFSE